MVRANKVWKKMLAEYEAPALDPGIDESILEFIAKKKASMPDAFAWAKGSALHPSRRSLRSLLRMTPLWE